MNTAFYLCASTIPFESIFIAPIAYKEPLVYNLAVARELAKQIYVAERLAPPSLDAFRAAYASLWTQITSPAAIRQLAGSGQVAQVGIYGLQAYGVFKVCGIA